MLLETLSNYLAEVEKDLQSLKNYHIEKYEEEILTSTRANLRIRIRFSDGHLLELNEAVTIDSGKLEHLSYRYHFQDKNNSLIFRYDNTPHFNNLESFPHHKHLAKEVIATEKPAIAAVIEEVNKNLSTEI
ncbi:MAG: hypothetical protein GXO75_11795 [Calditrichaeota bacterium]|nr:hypothetical protein [Calditrichota bacterium]